MFSILHRRISSEIDSHFLLQSQFLKPISTTPPPRNHSNQSLSFTFSYLINLCGLSLESSISASKKVHFKSPSKPNLVLQFLRNHDFSNTQIANIISKHPTILLTNPKKTLLPKLEFFKQIGFSKDDIAHFLSKDHIFLRRGLERKIKPAYENLMDFLGSEEKVAAVIKSSRSSWVLQFNFQRLLGHKFEILQKYRAPKKNIVKLVRVRMQVLIKKNDRFDEL